MSPVYHCPKCLEDKNKLQVRINETDFWCSDCVAKYLPEVLEGLKEKANKRHECSRQEIPR